MKAVNRHLKKSLDAWDKPEEAGEAIGCLCSSFTFHADLFEEQCLARFLSIETDPLEEDLFFRSELELRLSQMSKVTVFVDASNATGDRSLRWNLIPVKIGLGVFHPKLQILVWEKHIRIIIGSANLTRQGYRQNAELLFTIDYFDGGEGDAKFLREALNFYDEVLTLGQASQRAQEDTRELIARCRSMVAAMKLEAPDVPYRFVPVLPSSKQSVFDAIEAARPNGERFGLGIIESPSFEQPGTINEAATAVWSLMKERGEAAISFRLRGSLDESQGIVEFYAPRELVEAKPQRSSAEIELLLINERYLGDQRPVHSKFIEMTGNRYSVFVCGSSNFSQPGLGLKSKNKANRNVEANILFVIDRDNDRNNERLLTDICLETVLVDAKDFKISWMPEKSDDEEGNAYDFEFATFVSSISFSRRADGGVYVITLEEDAPFFSVSNNDGSPAFASYSSRKREFKIGIGEREPCSELKISWDDKSCLFPVNINDQTHLPLPDLIASLSLEEIAKILQSKLTINQAVRKFMRERQEQPSLEVADFNPLNRVNSSGFVLQKTRLFSWTLRALKERLEMPVYSRDSFRSRLRGPFGVLAVKRALLKSFSLPEELAFFLGEMILELKTAEVQKAKGSLEDSIQKSELESVLSELKDELKVLAPMASADLRNYLNSTGIIDAA